MNGPQKQAWFAIGIFVACVIAYFTLLMCVGPAGAWAAFGLFGLWGFSPLIGRREHADERDRAINRKAALAAGIMSYLVFIAGCMGVWGIFSLHGQDQVSVQVLPGITGAGGIVFYLAWAVATLLGYRRHVEADNE